MFFVYYNVKHITGIPNNSTGQAVIEKSNWTIKDTLNKQNGVKNTSRNRLHNTLLTLNFLNTNEKGTTAAERHWIIEKSSELNQPVYFKDVLTSQWKPGDVLHWGRGFALVSTGEEKLWITSKLIDLIWKRETSWEREMISHSQRWQSHRRWEYHIRVGVGFCSCLCREIFIFKESRDLGHLAA